VAVGGDEPDQLLDEPGLADPRLTGHQQQPGVPGCRGAPRLACFPPRRRPADQRRARARGALPGGRVPGVPEPRGDGRRLGLGADTELALQPRDQVVVGAQGLAALAAPGQRLHEHPAGGLVEGVDAEQVAGVRDGVDVAAFGIGRGGQLRERLDGEAA
jgi:hypothetical protein